MPVSTEISAETFLDLIADTPAPCAWPLYAEDEVQVIYGKANLQAVLNVDFTVQLDTENYDNFTITPLTSLIDKIAALIVIDPTEVDYMTARRVMPGLTTVTPGTVRSTDFLSREVERIWLAILGVTEEINRAVVVPPDQVGVSTTRYLIDVPEDGKAPVWDAAAGRFIVGPNAADIAGAQGFAAAAASSATDAETAQTGAEAAAAMLPQNNPSGTVAPIATDDSASGYGVGSWWVDTVANESYRCLDASIGAAVWSETSIGIDELGNLAFLDTVDTAQIDAGAITSDKLAAGVISLPLGYISGLIMSNGTDADHDIDITVGVCRDSTDAANIKPIALTKQIDVTWVAGTGAGGLSSSLTAPANNTWYHVFAVLVGGSADILFDTDVDCTNGIADHTVTAYRRIGSILTDGSANIISFVQNGNRFDWSSPTLDIDVVQAAIATLRVVKVPTSLKVLANLTVTNTGGRQVYVSSPDQTDLAPSLTVAPLHTQDDAAGRGANDASVMTNTSAQLRFRLSASDPMKIVTNGWKDLRGA